MGAGRRPGRGRPRPAFRSDSIQSSAAFSSPRRPPDDPPATPTHGRPAPATIVPRHRNAPTPDNSPGYWTGDSWYAPKSCDAGDAGPDGPVAVGRLRGDGQRGRRARDPARHGRVGVV